MSKISISYPGSKADLSGAVRLPASKSISNRVLIMRALCNSDFRIDNLSEASDTVILKNALRAAAEQNPRQTIDVQDAGTAYRFLTAFLSCRHSRDFMLRGSERMHKRPIADLVDALNDRGADISYAGEKGYPPLLIRGKPLKGGRVVINTDISSQFVSALCLIAPVLDDGLLLEMKMETVSYSYIQMTLQLMSELGIRYSLKDNIIHIPCQQYQATDFAVENDWSSASFFYAMAMLADTAQIRFDLLKEKSVQGDAFIRIIAADFELNTNIIDGQVVLSKSAAPLTNISQSYNLNSYPDLAIPLIVACGLRYPDVTFAGLKHLQYKESDRLTALTTELKKVNVILKYEEDVLSFDNANYKPCNDTVRFDTYSDHRIAMALSMLALEGFTIVLNDTICVQKSFPGYFQELSKLGFRII